jgi:hypothetical protein
MEIAGYRSPQEGAAASASETEKGLGAVIAMLAQKYWEMETVRRSLMEEDDPDIIGEYEWQLKLLRQGESSLQRIMSGMQSRLKIPG